MTQSGYDYWRINGCIPHEVCDLLLSYGNWTTAKVGNEKGEIADIRKSEVTWIDDTFWESSFYKIICDVNEDSFNYDISGIEGSLQLTQYVAPQGHYDYHVDSFVTPNDKGLTRKLSMVVLLNNPNEFNGGVFEYLTGNHPNEIPLNKGDLIVFPSYYLHRVTPVTRGKRYSLVCWVEGKPFR